LNNKFLAAFTVTGGVWRLLQRDFAILDVRRAAFFGNKWMGDYSALLEGPLILRLAEERRAAWHRDYDDMNVMLFHEAPPFEDLLAVAEMFAANLNAARGIKI
jgi:hypothetical protein